MFVRPPPSAPWPLATFCQTGSSPLAARRAKLGWHECPAWRVFSGCPVDGARHAI